MAERKTLVCIQIEVWVPPEALAPASNLMVALIKAIVNGLWALRST